MVFFDTILKKITLGYLMNAKIVIVEDEEDLLELIEYNLQKEGFEVIGFLNTKQVTQIGRA